jgi:hypothetical protein
MLPGQAVGTFAGQQATRGARLRRVLSPETAPTVYPLWWVAAEVAAPVIVAVWLGVLTVQALRRRYRDKRAGRRDARKW